MIVVRLFGHWRRENMFMLDDRRSLFGLVLVIGLVLVVGVVCLSRRVSLKVVGSGIGT